MDGGRIQVPLGDPLVFVDNSVLLALEKLPPLTGILGARTVSQTSDAHEFNLREVAMDWNEHQTRLGGRLVLFGGKQGARGTPRGTAESIVGSFGRTHAAGMYYLTGVVARLAEVNNPLDQTQVRQNT